MHRVTKPRRARMLSRLLPLSVHAGRSCPRGALSTTASSLPPGAFGLVPLLHDGRPRIFVPMITTPHTFSNAATPVGGVGSRRPVQPCPDPRRRLILAHLEHAAGRLGLGRHAPPGHKGAGERRIREMNRDRVVQHPAHSRRRHRPAIGAVAVDGWGTIPFALSCSEDRSRRTFREGPGETTNGKRARPLSPMR